MMPPATRTRHDDAGARSATKPSTTSQVPRMRRNGQAQPMSAHSAAVRNSPSTSKAGASGRSEGRRPLAQSISALPQP